MTNLSHQSEFHRIENDFNFHRADSTKRETHEHIRNHVRTLAHRLDLICPAGKEKEQMLLKLEEAMFWANASVARNVPADPDDTEIREHLSK